jgi:hypothetical protein
MHVDDRQLIDTMLKHLYVSEHLIEDTASELQLDDAEVLDRVTSIMAESREMAFRKTDGNGLKQLTIAYWFFRGELPPPLEARIRELGVRDLKVQPHPGLEQLQRLVVLLAHPSRQQSLNTIADIHRLVSGHSAVKVIHHGVVQLP